MVWSLNLPISDIGKGLWAGWRTHRPAIRYLVLYFSAYVLAGGFGQGLMLIPGVAISYWPPAGIFVATLLLTPWRSWPWWVLTGGLAEMTCNALWFHNPVPFALVYYAANVLEALTAAWLLHRFAAKPFNFKSLDEVVAFIVLAAGLAPMVGATVIASTDAILGKHPFTTAWPLVWLGDATGLLVTAPLTMVAVLAWRARTMVSPGRIVEVAALVLTLLGVGVLSLRGVLPTVYLTLPPLLWAAARFQLAGAATALGLIALTTAMFTVTGQGEFAGDPELLHQKIVMLQVFLGVSAVSALIVAALSLQRQNALQALEAVNAELEARVTERTATLRESEERLRLLGDNLPDSALYQYRCGLDGEGRYLYVSAGIERLSGVPQSEVLRDAGTLHQRFRSEDVQRLQEAKARSLKDLCDIDEEVAMHRPDGEPRWMRRHSRPRRLPDGQTIWEGVQIDITERKRADEALLESRHRLREALDAAELGTWNFDSRTGRVTSDERFLRIFGNTVEGLTAEQALAHIHVGDRDRVAQAVAAATRPDGPVPYDVEYRVVHADGTIHWVAAKGLAGFSDEAGGRRLERFSGTVADITARQQSEEALRASEARTRLATEASGVGIWEWNVLTDQLRWDAQMFRIYAVAPAPGGLVQYRTWSEAVAPEDLAEQEKVLQDTVRRGGHSRRAFRIHRAGDGEPRHIESNETTRMNSQGQTEWVVGTNLDVTERMRFEEKLRRLAAELADADRRKDAFLATLAHELRNPLAVFSNSLEVMKRLGGDATRVEKARSMMERQMRQMVRLIDDLLDIGRITHDKLELRLQWVDVAELLRQAVEAVSPEAERSGQQLHLALSHEPLCLDADPHRLAQVLGNLLTNAVKYTDPGGHIWLSAERVGRHITVRVKDSGVGIAPEMLAKVFDRFTQLHGARQQSAGGLGIGLSLVKRLVEMHGGTVTAHSQGAGHGTEFVVRLPLPDQS